MGAELISGGLSFLSGLFGKKPKTLLPSQAMADTVKGARILSKTEGVNFLTLLQNSAGLTSGAGMQVGGSPPPLASLAVLGDMIEDKYGQDAKDRREHNRLQNELLTLEVDRARTLSTVATPSIVSGAAINGGRTANRTGGPTQFLPPDYGLPLPPVRVRNGLDGYEVLLDPGAAARLRLKTGDTMIGEDNEALWGDAFSEAISVGSTTIGLVEGTGPIVEDPDAPKPRPKPKAKDEWKPRRSVKPIKQNLRYN